MIHLTPLHTTPSSLTVKPAAELRPQKAQNKRGCHDFILLSHSLALKHSEQTHVSLLLFLLLFC